MSETLSVVHVEILTHLEIGPSRVVDLAYRAHVSQARVVAELYDLRRGGVVQRLKGDVWALAGYLPPPGPPKPPRRRVARPRYCRQCRHRRAAYDGICVRCDRQAPVVAAPPLRPVAVPYTAVFDGVEYEVVSVGGQSLLGSVDGMASSLLNPTR